MKNKVKIFISTCRLKSILLENLQLWKHCLLLPRHWREYPVLQMCEKCPRLLFLCWNKYSFELLTITSFIDLRILQLKYIPSFLKSAENLKPLMTTAILFFRITGRYCQEKAHLQALNYRHDFELVICLGSTYVILPWIMGYLDNSKVMCPIGVSTLWFIVWISAVFIASVTTGTSTSRTVGMSCEILWELLESMKYSKILFFSGNPLIQLNAEPTIRFHSALCWTWLQGRIYMKAGHKLRT